jgi:uncharacterized cupin superfamily protein
MSDQPKVRPPFVGNYRDLLSKDPCSYSDSEEFMKQGAPVGKALGLERIGIHIEVLEPGRRTSWPHAESAEEEFAYVIQGTPQVWIDGEIHDLNEGDFVAFPSGTGIAHTFINNSQKSVLLLVGGEASKPENRIIYPLNPDQNERMRLKGLLWQNAPLKERGDHDGLPDELRVSRREGHV